MLTKTAKVKDNFHFLPVSFLPLSLNFTIFYHSFGPLKSHSIALHFNLLRFISFFYSAFFLSRFSPLFRFNLNYFYLLLDFRLKRYSMTKWNSNHINYVTKCADYTPIEYKMNVLCSSEWTTEHRHRMKLNGKQRKCNKYILDIYFSYETWLWIGMESEEMIKVKKWKGKERKLSATIPYRMRSTTATTSTATARWVLFSNDYYYKSNYYRVDMDGVKMLQRRHFWSNLKCPAWVCVSVRPE